MMVTENPIRLKSPDELFGDLFIAVQTKRILGDYKTFVDSIPRLGIDEVMKRYHEEKDKPEFQLEAFVRTNFILPNTSHAKYVADTTMTVSKHIDQLWDILTRRTPNPLPADSLINLPFPYVVPGGRFREMFYWDSYFIMIGLELSGRHDLVKNMLDNFSFLIDTFGYVPNGNRTYFLGRSQPPFYSLMVNMLTEKKPELLIDYIPFLEKEYNWWMQGADQVCVEEPSCQRVVCMPGGEILNRFWEGKYTPRAEGYGKEEILSHGMDKETARKLYVHLRAGCESGWDFSSRWMHDPRSIRSIYASDIVPVDLNCLMVFMEELLSKAYGLKGDQEKRDKLFSLSLKRKNAIQKYFWDDKQQFFMDYDFVSRQTTTCLSLAAAYTLFFHVATQAQANAVMEKLRDHFLKPGGFVTTLTESDFQWDSPNGWAPLQWMTVKGLLNYNFNDLAVTGARRWIELNDKIFRQTGKLIEKYNVIDMSIFTGGGEYDLQDGFGWTNGVYLKLQSIL